jgi:hypothetical protein
VQAGNALRRPGMKHISITNVSSKTTTITEINILCIVQFIRNKIPFQDNRQLLVNRKMKGV